MAVFLFRASAVGPAGTPLSDYAEGDLVKLNEGGNPVEFYVAKHDYESALNGAGRTLVVRKDCHDDRAFDSGDLNAYASSDIDAWFNGTYKGLLDPAIQTAIGTTKFYYTPGGSGSYTVTTLERAVFTPSATELGRSANWVNVEGSALPIASTLQIAHQNGSATSQWTRSPYLNFGSLSVLLGSQGNIASSLSSTAFGPRPIFTLPSTILVGDDGLIV